MKFLARIRFDQNGVKDLTNKIWVNHGVTYTESGKFNGQAAYFDGASYLECDTNDLNFGTGDFTVAFWAKALKGKAYARILSSTSYPSILLRDTYTGASNDAFSVVVTSGERLIKVDNAVTDDKWHYFAVVRNRTMLYLAVDGTIKASKEISQDLKFNFAQSGKGMVGWGTQNPAAYYTGYLDDLIAVNKALWSENFRVPQGYLLDYYKLYKINNDVYGIQNSMLSKLTDSWASLTAAEKKALFESTNYETALAEDLAILGKFKVLTYSEAEDKTEIKMTTAPKDQLILPKGFMSVEKFDGIDKATLTDTVSGGGVCKLIVTTDLKTYQTYDFETQAWKNVDHTNLAAVKSSGIDAMQFANITRSEWDKLLKGKAGIGFACLLSIESTMDKCEINKLAVQVDMKGTWVK